MRVLVPTHWNEAETEGIVRVLVPTHWNEAETEGIVRVLVPTHWNEAKTEGIYSEGPCSFRSPGSATTTSSQHDSLSLLFQRRGGFLLKTTLRHAFYDTHRC